MVDGKLNQPPTAYPTLGQLILFFFCLKTENIGFQNATSRFMKIVEILILPYDIRIRFI